MVFDNTIDKKKHSNLIALIIKTKQKKTKEIRCHPRGNLK